ncbi:uncharacterized protein LOC128240850 isoform X7 [Mya arenaria]|nr:uncharacterized protein LOC128240850 isoform X7 [Mya arenaria]
MKRNGSPKKMQRTEQMCHISKPNNLSMDIAICAGNSDVHNGPAHYYEDIAPSSNIGNSDVHNGPAHYYVDIAPSSNIGKFVIVDSLIGVICIYLHRIAW